MRLIQVLPLSYLMLSGCSPGGNDAAPGPVVLNRASSVESPATASAQARAPVVSDPSYEVAVASAQADRVHALEVCDAKSKSERVACGREADAAYDTAKTAAQGLREGGQ